jgi:ATP phosphoribosyltransferase
VPAAANLAERIQSGVERAKRLAALGVDLVSTGSTLRANHLVEVEQIMEISSRLVVNQAALKLKREKLQPIIDAFAKASLREK